MAKKIRFPLKINDTDVRSIEDLRENFDLETVLGYYTNGKLVTWLRDRYYNEEADTIEALSADDEQLGSKLAKALGVEIEADENLDIEEVKFRREKLEMLSRYISDRKILDNMDIVAVDQDDLYDILDSGADKVYLFKETFSVPTRRGDVTYIGLNGAKVKLQGKTDYDFNAVNIHFENVEFTGITDPDEYCKIANCYADGNGVSENEEKMFEYYKKAADMGYAEAEAYVGICYLDGNGVNESVLEAINWLKKSAEKGCGLGYCGMADCFLNGYGVEKDENEAIKLNIKAYEQGLVDVACDIARIYYNLENYRKAIEWYEICINQGDENAKEKIGECYYKIAEQYRYGNSEDRHIRAFENYKKATDYGHIHSIYEVGSYYSNGGDVQIDEAEALKWFTIAAEKGDREAQYKLGFYYKNGIAVDQDYERAAEWYRKSAEQDYWWAYIAYGDCFFYGQGVDQDYKEAFEWYRKTSNGSAGMIRLGNCYFYGKGVEQDYYEAEKWYLEAADYEEKEAYVGLADCYSSKDSPLKNLEKAKYWFDSAVDAGVDPDEDLRLNFIDVIIQLMQIGENLDDIQL